MTKITQKTIFVVIFLVFCASLSFTNALHKHSSSTPVPVPVLSLDFHHEHHDAPIIDLHALSAEELQKPNSFLIQTVPQYTALFGSLLEEILVDYIPDNIFFVHAAADVLKKISLEHDGGISAVVYVPDRMKIALNVASYQKYHEFVGAEGLISPAFDRKMNKLGLEKLQKFEHCEDDERNDARNDERNKQKIEKNFFNNLFFTLSPKTISDPILHTTLEEYFTSIPKSLSSFYSYYLDVSSHLDSDEIFQDNKSLQQKQNFNKEKHIFSGKKLSSDSELISPREILLKLDKNNAVLNDPTVQSVDNVYDVATHSITTVFLAGFENEIENGIYNSKFQQISTNLSNNLTNLNQQELHNFKLSLKSNPGNLSGSMPAHVLDSLSTLSTIFAKKGIDFDHFFTTFDDTASLFAQPQSYPYQSAQKSPLQSIFPISTSIQQTKKPETTLGGSKVGLNTARIQFQSQLLFDDMEYVGETLAERLDSFNTMINKIEHNNKINIFSQKSNFFSSRGIDAQNSDNLIDFFTLKKIMSNHLSTQIDTKSFLPPNLQATAYCTPKTSLNMRAELIKYIDTIIFSIFESHYKTQITSSANSSDSIPPLTNTDLIDVTRAFIQHQINALRSHISNSIAHISSQSSTYGIELEFQNTVFNGYTRIGLTLGLDKFKAVPTDPDFSMGTLGPYHEAGITGSGVTISVGDTGADTSSCFFQDNDHPVPYTGIISRPTPSTGHRKFKSYLAFTDEIDVAAGHGSHVAGSAVGNCPVDGDNFSNGVASDAMLAFADIGLCGTLSRLLDHDPIFDHARNNGAIISSNSWGGTVDSWIHWGANNYYSLITRRIDNYLKNDQHLTPLWAAANNGAHAYSTLCTQAMSKNSVTIGSTQAQRAQALKTNPALIDSPAFTNSPSSFELRNMYGGTSSMGPTIDFRIKPDFVAPGNFIWSVKATDYSEKLPSPGHTATVNKSGTSMATPATAGLFGLIQQILMQNRIPSLAPYNVDDITNPLLRAIAMNSAQPMNYRASNTIEVPQSMRIQTFTLPNIKTTTPTAMTWFFRQLGQVLNIQYKGTVPTFGFYIRPSRSDPFIKTTTRSIRFMPLFDCPSTVATVTVYLGDDNGPDLSTAIQRVAFRPQAADKVNRANIEVTIANIHTQQIFFRIDFEGPCTNPDLQYFQWTTLEFSDATPATSQRYMDVSCTDSFSSFSVYNQGNFVSTNVNFNCPSAPACSTTINDQVMVFGSRFYHQSSSICGSALHNGSVNTTLAEITNQDDISHYLSLNEREIVTAINSPASYTPGTRIPPSYYNGVYSNALPSGIDVDEMYRFQVGASQKPSPHLHLKKLPTGPNFISGYGMPQLSSVLPLPQYVSMPDGYNEGNSAQRGIVIFSEAKPTQNLTNHQSSSHCFFISSKPLLNTYKYKFGADKQSDEWTVDDSIKVSLAWIDQPGATSIYHGRTLVNDLDLFVFAPDGTEYRGNARADRNNNSERVDLLEGTVTPGMYCAVVHGTNVPIGTQRFALVANGRGVETCRANPIKPKNGAEEITVSGLWERKGVKCGATSNEDKDKLNKNSNTYKFFGKDPSKVNFHNINKLKIRQGGNCFSISDIPQGLLPQNTIHHNKSFSQQRLSTTQYEDTYQWDMDSRYGLASSPSNSTFVLSGHLDQHGAVIGQLLKEAIGKDDKDQTGPVNNSKYMEDNVEFDLGGSFDTTNGSSLSLKVVGSEQTCTYKFSRTHKYGNAQYSPFK
jgi:hypothetical protein